MLSHLRSGAGRVVQLLPAIATLLSTVAMLVLAANQVLEASKGVKNAGRGLRKNWAGSRPLPTLAEAGDPWPHGYEPAQNASLIEPAGSAPAARLSL